MRKDCLLINNSRGGIVNEADLVEAIKEKRIAGAGIDVVTQEPPRLIAPLPLYFELPQFYLNTPHRLDWTLHHKKSMEPSPRKHRKL